MALPSHTGYQWGLQYIDYRRIKGPPEESKGPPEAAEGPPEAAKGPPEASEGPSYNIRDLKEHNRFEMICNYNAECTVHTLQQSNEAKLTLNATKRLHFRLPRVLTALDCQNQIFL